MKYLKQILICILWLFFVWGFVSAFDQNSFCIDFSDQWRKDLPWLEKIFPSFETNLPDLSFSEYSGDEAINHDIDQMFCNETQFLIITRPELWVGDISWTQQTFGYNAEDTSNNPDIVSIKVSNQMKVEQSSCGYIQLIHGKSQLENFWYMNFLLEHARTTANYIDLYQNFPNWEELWVSSLWRFIVIDRAGNIVDRGTEDQIEDLDFFVQNECIEYNCNNNPNAEVDVDGDGVDNDPDEDIDNDAILNWDDVRDIDGDGVINAYDLDIDCDGLRNWHPDEDDIDGDGKNDEDDEDADGDWEDNEDDEDGDCDGCKWWDKWGDDQDDNGDEKADPMPELWEEDDQEWGEDEEGNEEENEEDSKDEGDDNSESWNELDSDGDGISDKQELIDGTDPNDANDFLDQDGNWNNGWWWDNNEENGKEKEEEQKEKEEDEKKDDDTKPLPGDDDWWDDDSKDNPDNLRVEIPYNNWYKDVNIDNDILTTRWEDLSLTKLVRQINVYLRVAAILILMWVIVYAWFLLITGRGDSEKLQKANKTLMYAGIGIWIAILAYAIVRIVVNLF